MRLFKSACYFLVGFALAAFALFADASFTKPTMYWDYFNNTYTLTTAADSCASRSRYYDRNDPNYAHRWSILANGLCYIEKNYPSTGWGSLESLSVQFTVACPSNSTASGSSCSCNLGYNESGSSCVAGCSSTGSATASQWYAIPANTAGGFSFGSCVSGCKATWTSTASAPSSKYVVTNGQSQLYAYGSYQFLGNGASDGCTPTTSVPTPSGSATLPTPTCGANQYKAVVSGKSVCVSSSSNAVVPTGPTFVTGTSCSNVTNSDSTVTQTCITQAADGSTTSTATKYPSAAAAPAATSTTTTTTNNTSTTTTSYGGGGSGGSGSPMSGLTGEPEGSMGDYCAKNPDANACKTTSAGTASGTDGLYTKDSTSKTFGSSVQTFHDTISSGGFYSAAVNFFNVSNIPAGSCSGLSTSFDLRGRVFTFDLTPTLCSQQSSTWYSLLGAGLLLAATWAAFRIAIL